VDADVWNESVYRCGWSMPRLLGKVVDSYNVMIVLIDFARCRGRFDQSISDH
jgi:hypothetical protein